MAQDGFINDDRAVKLICDSIDGIKCAINAQAAGQNVGTNVMVTLGRLDERMGQLERSQQNTQRILLGMVVSILLSVITLVMNGALLK